MIMLGKYFIFISTERLGCSAKCFSQWLEYRNIFLFYIFYIFIKEYVLFCNMKIKASFSKIPSKATREVE